MEKSKDLDPMGCMFMWFIFAFVFGFGNLIAISVSQQKEDDRINEALNKQPIMKVEDIRLRHYDAFVVNHSIQKTEYHFKVGGKWVRSGRDTYSVDLQKMAEIDTTNYVRYLADAEGYLIRFVKVK
ncbi:MAG: hypothetical protein LBL47_03130 [Lactobacillus sp.]|jgi:hypothetical protein|nr:hypothetical protein [Lactobacillus sp.]